MRNTTPLRRSMILATLALSAWALPAQRPLHLATGTITPAPLAAATAIDPSEHIDGRAYRILQFSAEALPQARERASALGIRLLSYLPDHAFLASLPQGADLAALAPIGVVAIHRPGPSQKLRPSLQQVPLPEWAVPAPGLVDVNLSHPEDITPARAEALALAMGLEPIPATHAGILSLRLPAHRLQELAAQPWVSFVEPISPPAQPENYTGRTLHRSNVIASDHPMGRHYDGTGVIVAMGDDGIIGPHIDHHGRADQSRVTQDNGTHGDHVAGTIFGAGNLNPKNKGMAFGATLHVYQVWNAVNDGAIANATYGTLLTSTSYSDGCNAGYTSFARSMDQMTRQTPTLLHVFSAGNEGTSDCGYGAGIGWGNVTGGVKIGKNVLAVASLNANGSIESYSSRGPTEDGRLKPEVGAKGGNVTSTYPDNTYFTQSGTSMACPGVSGTLAQLAQAHRAINANQDPPSALLKAVLMNGCDDRGNPGPDFKYGYGEVNALRSVLALENHTYFGDTLTPSQVDTHSIQVPAGTAQLKVMLYWHDYEGANNASRPLVNDLELRVVDPSTQLFLPWILNHTPSATALNSNATRGRDSINNVEQVTIDAPAPGTYQFIVSAQALPISPQGYHLVYELRDSSITVTYPIGGESLVPGESEKIRWDAEGNTGNFSIDYSTNGGTTWASVSPSVSGANRFLDWIVPSNLQTAQLRIRVSRGGQSDESDYNASVIRVPNNLQVLNACPTYCVLRWDSLTTASAYDVFMLGAMYMDSIGTTTNRSFTVTGINANQEYWFAVRARDANGAIGRRTIAIYKAPGVFNCLDPDDVGVSLINGPSGLMQTCALGNTLPITVTVRNHSPNTVSNIPVSYQIGSNTPVTETFAGPLPGGGAQTYTFSTTAAIPANGTHAIRAWTSFGQDPYNVNDSTAISFQLLTGTTVSAPFSEDFESFSPCSVTSVCQNANCTLANGWLQGTNNTTDDTDWRTDRGGTPTQNTGPTIDHRPGTSLGNYLYVEGSNCFERTAMLYSPCLNLAGMSQPTFSFWFSMYGADMGDLHIDAFANGQWNLDVIPPVIGNWGVNWWQRQVNLSAYAGQVVNIRFRGITGADALSDMAIDDIRLTEGPPVGIDGGEAAAGLQVHPNPSNGAFEWALAQPATGPLRLTIRDVTGRIVIEQKILNFASGAMQGAFDLSDQASGVFFLEIEADGQHFTKRIALTR